MHAYFAFVSPGKVTLNGCCVDLGPTSAPAVFLGTCPCLLSPPTPQPPRFILCELHFQARFPFYDSRMAVPYSPTSMHTEKTKLSFLVFLVKISESLWLGQSRSHLTLKSSSVCSLPTLSMDLEKGALGIPGQIQGLFLEKLGCRLESWGGMIP